MTCPACESVISDGSYWCSICHANTVNLHIGRLATPGKRLTAYVLDGIIPLGVISFLALSAAVGHGLAGEATSGIIMVIFGCLLFAYAILNLILFANGTTPGKTMLGMRVVREDGNNAGFFTMLIREFVGKPLSGMIFMLGYLSILIDKNHQGWHDKFVSTYVVDDQE